MQILEVTYELKMKLTPVILSKDTLFFKISKIKFNLI
jgi:hypothetical protein